MRGKVRRFLFRALRLTVESMLIRQLAHDIAQDLAAFSGTARAWHRPGLDRMAEVRGEFLVRGNSADAKEK
jgi:hypothetical protein